MGDAAASPVDTSMWCDCSDAPLIVRGAATVLDHPGGCAFPAGICQVREHRVTVHVACGRELRMRFCGCGATAFAWDVERDWWVHHVCGWPTRAWYEAAGAPAPDRIAGWRPVTYHEFVAVPSSPRSVYDSLSAEQRRSNEGHAGAWVRD